LAGTGDFVGGEVAICVVHHSTANSDFAHPYACCPARLYIVRLADESDDGLFFIREPLLSKSRYE